MGARNNLATHLISESCEIFVLNSWHITGKFFIFLFLQFPLKNVIFHSFLLQNALFFPKNHAKITPFTEKFPKTFQQKSRKTKMENVKFRGKKFKNDWQAAGRKATSASRKNVKN
ncbi:MAG: hypothetical protein MJZ85_08010 [Bacteroidales bacterium]|nr:hypothetical protein [Bacteroidales bacterium]